MGKAKPDAGLTPLETEIMRALWSEGPSTVQAVQQRLRETRPLAYNTVQTMLTILHRKRKVKRVIRNRAYVYSAAVTQEKAAARALKDLVNRLFGGKPEALVLNMVKSRQLTAEQLAQLQELVERGGDENEKFD
jgi:predicted transcriptional regulator